MEAGLELKYDSSSKFWYSREVQGVRCDVEDGSKVRFWHDLWPV